MCTVVFLPSGDGGYVLGHNRDESARRSRGLPPRRRRRRDAAFLAPFDPDGGGSWIGVNDAGLTVCLLNAEERDPARLPASPTSRGRIVWSVLDARSVDDLEARLAPRTADLREVRAFHLVAVQPGTRGRRARASRLRWNGLSAYWDDEDRPALFVSSGYDQGAAERARRRSWQRLLAAPAGPGAVDLARWLTSHEPERGPLSVCMHRPEARTVSRTLVEVAGDSAAMRYLDGSPCEPAAPEVRRTLRLRPR